MESIPLFRAPPVDRHEPGLRGVSIYSLAWYSAGLAMFGGMARFLANTIFVTQITSTVFVRTGSPPTGVGVRRSGVIVCQGGQRLCRSLVRTVFKMPVYSRSCLEKFPSKHNPLNASRAWPYDVWKGTTVSLR